MSGNNETEVSTQSVSYDNDICFKCYFGEMNEDSQFLRNSMCEYAIGNGIKIVHSDVINSEIIPDQLGKKKVILDIRAKDKQGRLYAIEMQRQPTQTDINRWEYYGARNLTKQLDKGYEYGAIAPVYQIIFTYQHNNNKKLINRYVMRNEDGQKEQKQPLLNRIYINISAIDTIVEKKGIEGLNEHEEIFYLFKNNGLCDTMKPRKPVNTIMEKYDNLKNDEEQWTWAQKLEEAEVRERYAISQYREEGREEGKIELIQQQLKLKYQIDASTWLTSLSKEQLNKVCILVLTCDTFEDLQNQIKAPESSDE